MIFSYVNLYPQGNISLMYFCDSNQVLTVFVEFASPVIGSEKDDKWAGGVWALELLLDKHNDFIVMYFGVNYL